MPLPVMPLFAPMYTIGSERAQVRWLTIVYETDSQKIDSLLPRPLLPGSESEVLIWVADFISATFTGEGASRELPRYTQGGIAVRAEYGGRSVAYPLVSYITGLNHGFTGRELFGLPKKQASAVVLDEQDDHVAASITTASGIDVISATGTLGTEMLAQDLVPEWFGHQHTVKLIPSVTGEGYDVDQLTHVPFTFGEHAAVRAVDAELSFVESASDPIADLPCKNIRHAAIGDVVLGVGYGRYLGTPQSHPVWGRA